MSNENLTERVEHELRFDPRVDNDAVVVSTDGGRVTLRGTVDSFAQKREVAKAARRVIGVASVENEIEVRILSYRGDDDLRGDVLRALRDDTLVPTSIDAGVVDGRVTLTGSADWQFECEQAEFVAGSVPGVVDVEAYVSLKHPLPDPNDIEGAIAKAFERNARIDATRITVARQNGTVVLRGSVRSSSERAAAVEAAYAAPGVKFVDDHIVVEP